MAAMLRGVKNKNPIHLRRFSSPPNRFPPPPCPPTPLPHRRPILLLALSGTLVSAAALAPLILPHPPDDILQRSRESLDRVLGGMRRTGAAATVLWRSLASVLSSANHEVQRGFELRVASLVADIAAANEGRRAAIVAAGRGMVVDWLLEAVAAGAGGKGRECRGTQAEAARALAYLISDPGTCEAVLGRPHAVPNLLRFIFSVQPNGGKKHKHSSLDVTNKFKGGSMLVAAIMDIVTSNCDHFDRTSFRPSLPANAIVGDILAAMQVIEEGGIHFDEQHHCDGEDDGDIGMRGIGIKVIGGTTILGFSKMDDPLLLGKYEANGFVSQSSGGLWHWSGTASPRFGQSISTSVPGLWDDLQGEHVAVPFAAWAITNWALASELNRSHILELDRDGKTIMSVLTAPERTVKWHGSLAAHVLLEDHNLPLMDSVPDWTFSLLSTISQASSNNDIPLVQAALSAFILSLQRSDDSRTVVMKKGLRLMREAAKGMENHRQVQENLAKALELVCTMDTGLSIEESQKWAAILLGWVFNKNRASNITCLSAIKILSCILEDHGPASIPVSQGWLVMLISEVLGERKITGKKGNHPKNDHVKSQINQSNVLSALQVCHQLADAVVSQAGNQIQVESDSSGLSPLVDFVSLEPFAASLKNFSKDKLRTFNASDSAMSTLKGVKALTELCSDDSVCQKKIVDCGVLPLLRRLLLSDDYERLVTTEAHDGSQFSGSLEQETVTGSSTDTSVQVPLAAHIRRHAARLLVNLSVHPVVKQAILADTILYKFLDECASGSSPCCDDPKFQSYARATLLNTNCTGNLDLDSPNDENQNIETKTSSRKKCLHYSDMLFLINPEMAHWKPSGRDDRGSTQQESVGTSGSATFCDTLSSHEHAFNGGLYNAATSMDIVFVHGLRGGPFKSWRIADNKSSTTSKAGLIEHIDQEAGKQGTFWPREWLSADLPRARLFTVKYKTNLSQWTGASLPLQEVSSLLLEKLLAAGIGDRPVVFITHSMGGLVVKQMLYEAKAHNFQKFVDNTVGVVFYSCPHFGSKLADVPWRMGFVLRPAPSIGELRSGSPRLMELNEFLRFRYNKGLVDILSFSETQVTPIVEGYGGWAFRIEIVPMESAYPGFGNIIVLDSTDHINSCKPVNRTDPSYARTLEFLQKLKAILP